MKCPRCLKQGPAGASYCVWCGSRLADANDSLRQPMLGESGLREVKSLLDEIATRLSALEQQMEVINRRMGVEPAEARSELPTAAGAGQSPAGVDDQPSKVAAAVSVETAALPEAVAATPNLQKTTGSIGAPAKGAKWPGDWERWLPGNWLSRIGIMALFIGLGFLAKLAYDRGWVGPVVQLLVGLGCGGVLLLAGHHWIGRYRIWAQALTGGGIAVLYLSIFASYALYPEPLIPFLPTFALMFLVTVLAVAIAARRESMSIAIIGIVGAFLVPIILGASDLYGADTDGTKNNPGLLIAYILVLDVGVVWLATFRNWRWFTLLGLAGSLAVYGLWYATSGREDSLLAAHGYLTGIFLCFVAATTLFHVVWKRTPEATDLALMSLNAAVYFGVSYSLLWADYRGWLGLFSMLLAGFYVLIGLLALRRSKDNRRLADFAFGIAIVFLTIAMPVQLEGSWMAVGWAAEGAILMWIAVRQDIRQLQVWGLAAFGLAVIGLLLFAQGVDRADYRPVLNVRVLSFVISIVAMYVGAYFQRRNPKALQAWFFPLLVLTASFLTIWLFSAEIVSFAGSRAAGGVEDMRNLENARNLALVGVWAMYGLILLLVGIRRNWDWLRIGGYVLMVVASGASLILLNHSYAEVQQGTSTPILNPSFGALAICIGVLYLCSYMMVKNSSKLRDFEKIVLPALVVSANVFTLSALSSEVLTYVGGGYAKSMWLTLLWAMYGLVLVILGVAGRWRWVRLGGLVVIAIAIFKLFIVDTFTLQSGYRVAAYLVLGTLLLIIGFVYHRYAEVIKGLILDRPAKEDRTSHD